MQYINLNKMIELDNEIEDLMLISIDEQIDTIDDKEGIKITGKIAVGGKVKTSEENREFSDFIDLDIFLTYEEIVERNSLNISVNDFNYKIEGNKLYLDISLKIDGLKEIETTFLAKEDNELFSKEEVDDEKRVFIDEEIIINNIEEETSNSDDKEIVETKIEVQNINEELKERKIEEIEIVEEQMEIKEPKVENAIKKSLLKTVFSNKRIKEEVSWRLHCVRGEKSYDEIATQYGVNVNKLISINKNESLAEGKLIFIPIE